MIFTTKEKLEKVFGKRYNDFKDSKRIKQKGDVYYWQDKLVMSAGNGHHTLATGEEAIIWYVSGLYDMKTNFTDL